MEIRSTQRDRIYGWAQSTYSDSHIFKPETIEQIADVLHSAERQGMTVSCRTGGNAYGDNTLNTDQVVLDLSQFRRLLSFDSNTGILRAQAGASMNDILISTVPQGWMLPVMPGTRRVTVSGALANNVHGKNCFSQGYFGEHVLSFRLMLADSTVVECSRNRNTDLFYSAISGHGLLGVVLDADLQLRRVPSFFLWQREKSFGSLESLIGAYEDLKGKFEYSIGQVDAIKWGSQIGRGSLQLSQFVEDGNFKIIDHEVPKYLLGILPHSYLPFFTKKLLGRNAVRVINSAKYHLVEHSNQEIQKKISFSAMHFLMDRQIPKYNFFFKDGIIEYQAMLPTSNALSGFSELLKLSRRQGFYSMMSPLKAHRQQKEPFLLTPSVDGYSFAFSFPKEPLRLKEQVALCHAMNDSVIKNGGRIYLAKTSALHREHFFAMYPKASQFLATKEKFDPNSVFQSNLYRRIFRISRNGQLPPSELDV